jgi:protein-S-isoprenylcysteine O-methyltransferase Ste14
MTGMLRNYYSFYRLAYVLISIILFVPLIKLTAAINDPVIVIYSFPFSGIRQVLISGSLLMFFWAFFIDYDFLSFWGIRQILNYKKNEKANPTEKFKKSGLLGITRHPMYFALIIYLWCQTFRMVDILINTVLTLYILIGTRLEENKLVMEFGDLYIKYQQEVPMLIPYIKIAFIDFHFSRRKNLTAPGPSN